MKDCWITRTITEESPIFSHIPGVKPGTYDFMWDTYRGLLLVRETASGRELTPIPMKSASDLMNFMNRNTFVESEEDPETGEKSTQFVVNYRLPNGEIIHVKITRQDNKNFEIRPLAGNSFHVHHHIFDDPKTGTTEIIFRDQSNQNVAAYIFDKSRNTLNERPLTDAEKRPRGR
ncbi:hypothetical protein [Trichormus sp. NMC-1]|uniref:hypothetical protein n=1 Tax=Trichormus sp. NMC-1 TaxID=1853259 RepID=UPI0008DC0181|nr:hypothetical protein [Trichormus sp. NMC-1]